jgi:hypothetical protein
VKIDKSTANDVIGDLQARGLVVEHEGTLRPTVQGWTLFVQINRRSSN